MEKIVGKIVVTGVLAATLAVPSWAEGFNSQFSGPLVEVDGYNAVLGAIASFSGPTAPLISDSAISGSNFAADQSKSTPIIWRWAPRPPPIHRQSLRELRFRARLCRPPLVGNPDDTENNASGGSRVGSVIKLQWRTGKLGPLAGAHHPTLSCCAVLLVHSVFARLGQRIRKNTMDQRKIVSWSAMTVLGFALLPGNAVAQSSDIDDQGMPFMSRLTVAFHHACKLGFKPQAAQIILIGSCEETRVTSRLPDRSGT